jgi:hypothetical protein
MLGHATFLQHIPGQPNLTGTNGLQTKQQGSDRAKVAGDIKQEKMTFHFDRVH